MGIEGRARITMSAAPSAHRVLLIGATGQLGHTLAQALRELGPVFKLARAQLDLTEIDRIESVVMPVRPTIIVNAAAYTAVDDAQSQPELAHAINADAAGILANCAQRLGAYFIHYSTDYVFAGDSETPYDESSRTAPINVYGRSKRDGERAVLAAHSQALVFRTSAVYSAYGRNFLLTVRRLVRDATPLRIVDDQFTRPTSTQQIAAATITALKCFSAMSDAEQRSKAGIYHVCASGIASWYDFACAIIAIDPCLASHRNAKIRAITSDAYGARAPRPRFSVLDCSKAKQTFGIELAHWRDALKAVLVSC